MICKQLNFKFFLLVLMASCTQKEVQKPTEYSKDNFIEYSKQINKNLKDYENEKIQDYIKKQDLNFIKTNSGFYMTATKLNGYLPQNGDIVEFSYTVGNLENKIIYSEEEIGIKKIELGKSMIPIGLEYAIKRMSPGEWAKAIFPSGLAYALQGDGNKIKADEVLVFNINLKEIQIK